jgi:hypothetical protein
MDRVVNEIVDMVNLKCPRQSTTFDLLAPSALIRFARGGKTMTLAKVFSTLKLQSLYHPIFISFNGSGHSNFARMSGETQKDAILRLIAVQLGEYDEHQAKNVKVDVDILDKYLGDNVVLLIDELNLLAPCIEPDAATLLRELFLDRRNRYLVFTSHYTLELDEAKLASCYMGSTTNGSNRGIISFSMSLASSTNALSELRSMSTFCEGLTESRAAWLGYIPSLVYISMSPTAIINPYKRFMLSGVSVPNESRTEVLTHFVSELLTGIKEAKVAKYFKCFSSIGSDLKVSYPPCYIYPILEQLKTARPAMVTAILKALDKLQAGLDQVNSGMEWEGTVQVAVLLRMLHAELSGDAGPFGVSPERVVGLQLSYRTLPHEVVTVSDAHTAMKEIINTYNSPTIIFVDNLNKQFQVVEGFVIFTRGDGVPMNDVIIGFQAKRGKNGPTKRIDKRKINGGGILLSGKEAKRKLLSGWVYYTTQQIKDFIGTSLLLAMPRDILNNR